eukprot:6196283-Pleurochrysis_carterae.AAC.2
MRPGTSSRSSGPPTCLSSAARSRRASTPVCRRAKRVNCAYRIAPAARFLSATFARRRTSMRCFSSRSDWPETVSD